MNTKVTAVVKLEVNVHLTQPWDGEEKMNQVHKRASIQAHEALVQVISQCRIGSASATLEVRGTPKVTMVLVEKE